MVTVRKLLQMLPDVSVYAGQGGLDKVVQTVSFIDSPSSVDWLNGGEIILTTAFLYKENAEMQFKFVQKIIDMGVVALGIKIGRYVDKLPESIIELANEKNFPVFRIGFDMVWSEIFSAFYRLNLDKKNSRSVLSTEIVAFDKLFRASTWDSKTIRTQFLKCISIPAAIVDEAYERLSESENSDSVEWKSMEKHCKRMQKICASRENPERFVTHTEQGGKLFDYALYPGERIILFSGNENIQETEIEWILALYKKIRAKNRFMQDMPTLWKNFIKECLLQCSEENLMDYIRVLNLQEGSLKVLLIFSGSMAISASDKVQQIQRSAFNRKEITIHCTAMDNGDVIMLYESMQVYDKHLLSIELRALLKEILEEYSDVKVQVGKPVVAPRDIKMSYQCANTAARLGERLFPKDRLIFYEDICMIEFLQQKQYDFGTIEYLNKSITTFDSCTTLQTFLECGNTKRAAECLFIHDNTLRYRIQKIEEYLNVDLSEPLIRVSLLLKIKLWLLLRGSAGKNDSVQYPETLEFSQASNQSAACQGNMSLPNYKSLK